MHDIAAIVDKLSNDVVNVIDVGCYTGKVTQDFAGLLPHKQIFSIGIDPIEHYKIYKFSHYVKAGIRNGPTTDATLYHYSDPMCNSLLKMSDNITHDPAEKATKWFGGHDFDRLQATSIVQITSLLAIIEQFELVDKIIHFLKIDSQGLDLEVILSLGKYISNCLFIQMETVTSGNRNITLYEGQTIYEDEVPILNSYGFEVFSTVRYDETYGSPEADVVYINKALQGRLENL